MDGSVTTRWENLAGLVAVFVTLALAAFPALGAPAKQHPTSSRVVDLPVTFTVVNVNRSRVPCLTDGKQYKISGHIVGPQSALRDGAAATLYLHGAATPEPTWRMPVPGYDHAVEQAKQGHVSVTYDRLGYGRSPTPNGLLTCSGGQADMAHQIILQLRSGTYHATRPVRFAKVALAGHSNGQVIAQIEAYSFGDIDALAVGGWGDPAPSPDGAASLRPTILVCATGGEPKRPGEPAGYAYAFEHTERQYLFHNASPKVVAAYVSRHERDACDGSFFYGSPVTAASLNQIRVPVLLFYGLEDALWPAGTGERQQQLFTGSDDVTLLEIPGTGHMVMLEQSAPAFRQHLSRWLHARGF